MVMWKCTQVLQGVYIHQLFVSSTFLESLLMVLRCGILTDKGTSSCSRRNYALSLQACSACNLLSSDACVTTKVQMNRLACSWDPSSAWGRECIEVCTIRAAWTCNANFSSTCIICYLYIYVIYILYVMAVVAHGFYPRELDPRLPLQGSIGPCVAKWLSVHGGRNSCIYKNLQTSFIIFIVVSHVSLHFTSLFHPGRFDPTSTCQAGEGHGRGLPSPYFARHTCVVILSSLAEL